MQGAIAAAAAAGLCACCVCETTHKKTGAYLVCPKIVLCGASVRGRRGQLQVPATATLRPVRAPLLHAAFACDANPCVPACACVPVACACVRRTHLYVFETIGGLKLRALLQASGGSIGRSSGPHNRASALPWSRARPLSAHTQLKPPPPMPGRGDAAESSSALDVASHHTMESAHTHVTCVRACMCL